MTRIQKIKGPFGATVTGVDLSKPLSATDQQTILSALGENGFLSFRDQKLEPVSLREFSRAFGSLEVNVANTFQAHNLPEVMVLSNMTDNGKPIGLSDAGQSWHTDMAYNRIIALASVLHAIKIPVRNGVALGQTEFCDMHAAYDGLPPKIKQDLAGKTVSHDFNKFWEEMRSRPGSQRAPLSAAQRKAKPPVSHPIFLDHPVTGRKVLYCNPGYAVRINELPQAESDVMLGYLFDHQTQERFKSAHQWQVGDVLMWDNIGTIHNAVANYGPDEHRMLWRCQIMADRYFA